MDSPNHHFRFMIHVAATHGPCIGQKVVFMRERLDKLGCHLPRESFRCQPCSGLKISGGWNPSAVDEDGNPAPEVRKSSDMYLSIDVSVALYSSATWIYVPQCASVRFVQESSLLVSKRVSTTHTMRVIRCESIRDRAQTDAYHGKCPLDHSCWRVEMSVHMVTLIHQDVSSSADVEVDKTRTDRYSTSRYSTSQRSASFVLNRPCLEDDGKTSLALRPCSHRYQHGDLRTRVGASRMRMPSRGILTFTYELRPYGARFR